MMLRSFCVGVFLDLKWNPKVILRKDDDPKGKGKVEEEAKPEPEKVRSKNRGWENLPTRETPVGASTKPAPVKKWLSVDTNVIIAAAKGDIDEHPSVKALISEYQLLVTSRVAEEILDSKSRSFLSTNCKVEAATPRATELTRAYCDRLKKGETPDKPRPAGILFTGNEEVDLACYLDACLRGLPHLTLDRNFAERIMYRHDQFEDFAEKEHVTLSTLYVGLRGKTTKIHPMYFDDRAVERNAPYIKVLRDK